MQPQMETEATRKEQTLDEVLDERTIDLLEEALEETEKKQVDQARVKLLVENAKFTVKQRWAQAFAASGAFSEIKGKPQNEAIGLALVKIELGEAMGFTPAESMTGIDVIQGRVAVGAALRAARMQRAGFSWRFSQCDDEGCAILLYFKGKPLLNADGSHAACSYTSKDAERAKLIDKDNYKKNPSDMYFARCITRAQRRYAPGVLGVDILSKEEAIDLTDPDEQFKYGGSRDAQVQVMNEKLAQYAMKKIEEEREQVVTVKAIPDKDIPHKTEKGDGQKPEDAPEGKTPVSEVAPQITGGTTVKSPPSPAAVQEQSKPSKPVFGVKPR